MTTERSGIPTMYHGTAFRSRLEARWAAMFDLLRWDWTYEPFDTPGWIPDFLIQGPRPFLVEIGPCVTRDDYLAKATKPLRYHDRPTVVLGAALRFASGDWFDYAGLIVNEFESGGAYPGFWCPADYGEWHWALFGDDHHVPCGHSFASHRHATRDDDRELDELWRRAGNDVQWEARRPQRLSDVMRGLR